MNKLVTVSSVESELSKLEAWIDRHSSDLLYLNKQQLEHERQAKMLISQQNTLATRLATAREAAARLRAGRVSDKP